MTAKLNEEKLYDDDYIIFVNNVDEHQMSNLESWSKKVSGKIKVFS